MGIHSDSSSLCLLPINASISAGRQTLKIALDPSVHTGRRSQVTHTQITGKRLFHSNVTVRSRLKCFCKVASVHVQVGQVVQLTCTKLALGGKVSAWLLCCVRGILQGVLGCANKVAHYRVYANMRLA